MWKIGHSELHNLTNWPADWEKFATENCGP